MNTIYFFSGSGNSLSIAKTIAEEIGDTRLIRITKIAFQENLHAEGERIGFVVPVYMTRVPNMVVRFVKQIEINQGAYIFTAVTCGGGAMGAVGIMNRILKNRGHQVSASFEFDMPANNQTRYAPVSSEVSRAMAETAKRKAQEAARIIAGKGALPVRSSLRQSAVTSIGKLYEVSPDCDKNFHVTDTCIGCGTCVKICPAENIELIDNRPMWEHSCERCTACLQFCPTQAIQYGTASQNWGRYHHPDVELLDMIQ